MTENDLLVFIHSRRPARPEERQPGEFTVLELAEAEGVTREVVEAILKRGMDGGQVTRRPAIINGTKGFLYRMMA